MDRENGVDIKIYACWYCPYFVKDVRDDYQNFWCALNGTTMTTYEAKESVYTGCEFLA